MEASTTPPVWRSPAKAEELLRPGYDDKLFFHTWTHALATRDEARELGKWCAYNGLEVDFGVLEWAALGHDYGFFEWAGLPPEQKAVYPSREKYASARTRSLMEQVGAPEETISHVEAAIASTELHVHCTSLEGRILRQADLANVGNTNTPANIISFLGSTLHLYQEKLLFEGRWPWSFRLDEFLVFALKSHGVLSAYNEEDVSLGDFDRTKPGNSMFAACASEKIAYLKDRPLLEKLARITGESLVDRKDELS